MCPNIERKYSKKQKENGKGKERIMCKGKKEKKNRQSIKSQKENRCRKIKRTILKTGVKVESN